MILEMRAIGMRASEMRASGYIPTEGLIFVKVAKFHSFSFINDKVIQVSAGQPPKFD